MKPIRKVVRKQAKTRPRRNAVSKRQRKPTQTKGLAKQRLKRVAIQYGWREDQMSTAA